MVCVSSWILAICSGKKTGASTSDVTAAFDRVFKDFLLAKLYSVGVNDVYLRFLSSYLEPRVGHVVVEGVLSDLMILADTVFQGTLLGPAAQWRIIILYIYIYIYIYVKCVYIYIYFD